MIDPQFLLALLALGALVGFVAGLLGVGGGGLMVPILTSLFLWQKVPVASVPIRRQRLPTMGRLISTL